MRFYYFLTPSLTYSPPRKKSHASWKSSSGKHGAAAAQRVPQSPLPAVPTSAVAWAKHRLYFNASISQLLTLQLSEKELKKIPLSLSPAPHTCTAAVVPSGPHSQREHWGRAGPTVWNGFVRSQPVPPVSEKLTYFLSFSSSTSPIFFPSHTQSCKMCIFVLQQAISHSACEGMDAKRGAWGCF